MEELLQTKSKLQTLRIKIKDVIEEHVHMYKDLQVLYL